jgi:hypothetical protein
VRGNGKTTPSKQLNLMKKGTYLLIMGCLAAWPALFGQVGVGTGTPDPSAILDLQSTNRGFLLPRMTGEQRDAIVNPAEGLLIFNLTTGCIDYYFGGSWKAFCGTTPPEFLCGTDITIEHATGDVAPVDKTTTYGTVADIPGEPSKCWITSNLGADRQALAADDATELSAGWYWQFNKKKGYKHDGTDLTPAWTITVIDEVSDWLAAQDPCALELGNAWRIPTLSEWTNVDNAGGWSDRSGPWASGLKLHAAGILNAADGSLDYRGVTGAYWSSTHYNDENDHTWSWFLDIESDYCNPEGWPKANGFSVRCLRD